MIKGAFCFQLEYHVPQILITGACFAFICMTKSVVASALFFVHEQLPPHLAFVKLRK